jgi:hypothetical protein
MVEGRSKQVFKTWLAARPQAWRDQLEVVAMDGPVADRGEVDDHGHVLVTAAGVPPHVPPTSKGKVTG